MVAGIGRPPRPATSALVRSVCRARRRLSGLPRPAAALDTARIPGSIEYEATLIPDSAIVVDQSNSVLMTVAEDGTVVPKPIQPGPSQPGGLRIVREGLTGDEKVIINGLLRARPGAKVTPQPGTIAPEPTLTLN